ncbi:TonB family protein [Paraburkholderia dipogonis]|uniref:TonB family protein n=1 Tax=Paraburkholderia dipogonis TaxID=1211383 RepID=A0A4Y8MP84_9BURK|nr:TonB family protein [Paraburkholderia dipogonis]TFE39234.1 TonB family protein [Paraburkholderia dipogonis]
MRLTTTIDDSQTLRIVLSIVVALVVWIVFLLALGHWLDATTSEPAPDKPLEMRVVELDPQSPVHPEPMPTIKPQRPDEPRPHATPKPAQARAPRLPPPDIQPTRIPAPNEPTAPTTRSNNSQEERQSTSQPTLPPSDTAARSIAQPLPELPDDLREQAYQTIATARFVIHVDGSVDVELLKPTQNPRLNQLLLEALRKWRFFPALQGDRPIESKQDVRVHFNVS